MIAYRTIRSKPLVLQVFIDGGPRGRIYEVLTGEYQYRIGHQRGEVFADLSDCKASLA